MKTAVEWLKDTLYPYFDKEDREYTNILFEKAKEMEEDQRKKDVINAWNSAAGGDAFSSAGQYYISNFKSE
jgi:hypothetical protein